MKKVRVRADWLGRLIVQIYTKEFVLGTGYKYYWRDAKVTDLDTLSGVEL